MYVSQKDLHQETKFRYLAYLGGQGVFFCREHNLHLSTDYMNSRRKCSLRKAPQESFARVDLLGAALREVALRPSAGNILPSFPSITIKCFLPNRAVDGDINDCSDENVTDNLQNILTNQNPLAENQNETMEEVNGPNLILDAGFQDRDNFSTDSGCEPVYVSNDSKFGPMHVLLNGECKLVKRLKYPNHIGKNFNDLSRTLFRLFLDVQFHYFSLKRAFFLAFFTNSWQMVLFRALYRSFYTMTEVKIPNSISKICMNN